MVIKALQVKSKNLGALIHKANFKLMLIYVLLLTLSVSCTEENNTKLKNKNSNTSETLSAINKKPNAANFKANIAREIGKEVLSVLQDKNGNYWLGTNNGVYCYDGKTLIVFTTKDGLFQNQVQDIQEDDLGNIWFTTGGFGVSYFDGEKITSLTLKNNIPTNTSLEQNWKINKGDLWFNAGGGAFRHYKDSFTYSPFPKPDFDSKYSPKPPYEYSAYGVYSSLKDKNENIWFGTQAMGVCKYDGKRFTWFTEEGLRGPAVLALFEDKNGNIWFGNNGNGLFCYDGKTLTNITEKNGLSNPEFVKTGKSGPGTLARVWAINEDNTGTLWIGTGDAGIWCYDGKNLINYSTIHNLPINAIETIYKDKKGHLWFGTNGDGVYVFNGLSFKKFTPNESLF